MKCANCPSPALFEYRITQDKSQFYCGKHLPKFLEARRRSGALTITNVHEEEKNSALEFLSVKPSTQIAVEEDEAPAEPAPKKKRKPKNADNS